MELMPREPDGREQENTTPQRPGAPARSAVRPDAGEPRAIQEQVPGAEPLPPRSSAARIERIRRRKRMRRIRAAAVCAVLLAAVLAYFTGIYGASLALLGDAVDSIGIALTPSPGYPVSFTLSGYQNALPLAGGFVAVGDKDLAIYSAGGNEVRRIQHGYGRPAITAGNTRVCVYNRAGKELRVESRSRTLFENKFDDAIQLCAMSPNGTLAVFTKSKLYVYDPMFENIYTFQTQDLPTALAFAGDNRQFAAGCPYAEGGALGGTVYLMDTRKDEYVTIRNTEGMPVKIQYLTNAEAGAVRYLCRGVRYGRRNRVVPLFLRWAHAAERGHQRGQECGAAVWRRRARRIDAAYDSGRDPVRGGQCRRERARKRRGSQPYRCVCSDK